MIQQHAMMRRNIEYRDDGNDSDNHSCNKENEMNE